jgi:hypothetical protein
MPSSYIAAFEYANLGVPNATTAQVVSASAIVDAYLRRPEGLQWMPDAAGAPCYMAGLSPTITLKLTDSISPGLNVSVPLAVAPGMLTPTGSVGEVVILDRTNSAAVEACVISSVGQGSIVLQSVVYAHDAGTAAEFGLTIKEQKRLPAKRSITRVASWPVVRLISGLGSYRYGRRSEQNAGLYADQSVLAMMQTFGGPPEWIPFDVSTADVEPQSGEIWVPSGLFLAYYSDVRLFYVAGFSQGAIPACVKNATAAAIIAGLNSSDLAGGMRVARAGDTMLERFANTIVDGDMRAQLDMYRARLIA